MNAQTIEQMAVNCWPVTDNLDRWREIDNQFFGLYRYAAFECDEEAAELCKFLSDLCVGRRLCNP